jgi:hypothetical protein
VHDLGGQGSDLPQPSELVYAGYVSHLVESKNERQQLSMLDKEACQHKDYCYMNFPTLRSLCSASSLRLSSVSPGEGGSCDWLPVGAHTRYSHKHLRASSWLMHTVLWTSCANTYSASCHTTKKKICGYSVMTSGINSLNSHIPPYLVLLQHNTEPYKVTPFLCFDLCTFLKTCAPSYYFWFC